MKIPESDSASALQGNQGLGSSAQVQASKTARAEAGTRTGSSPSVGSSSDQASLGASAVALTAQVMSLPEVRTDRVQQLQSQIAAGAYSVSSAQVADRMLADPQVNLTGEEGD